MAFENSGVPWATQSGSFSAEQTRRAVMAMYARTSANSPGIISGGLLSTADLQLSNAVSGLVVDISTGEAVVGGSEGGAQGGYYCRNSTSSSLTLATASSSNPRVDLICITVDDTGYTPPSGGTSGQVSLQAVTGTPTSGANITPGSGGYLSGAASLPASSLLLGYVLVPTSATNLTSGDILNVATIAGPAGAWQVLSGMGLNASLGAASGWKVPAARIVYDEVEFRGQLATSGSISPGATLWTFPSALRPAVGAAIVVEYYSPPTLTACNLEIASNGVCTVVGATVPNGVNVLLDGERFTLS